MMNQCRACKHCIVIKADEMFTVDDFDCDFFPNRAEIDFYENCKFFEKIDKPEYYVESDLACDTCDFRKSNCECLDVTNIYDERDHYYDVKGNYCYMDNAIIEYEDDEDDFG